MNSKKFSEAMGEIGDKYIGEAISYQKKNKNQSWVKWASIAACFAVVIVGAYSLFPKGDILFKGENLTVKLVDFSQENVPSTGNSLVYLTEEEIFNNYNTAIIKGTVNDIENIEIDFDGDVAYRSIATISIQEIYRGDLQAGEEIKILLPLPIDVEGFAMAGVDVIPQIRVGMTGVFMPLILDDETAMWQQNDVWFDKREIVDYGLLDGERFAFLETENGLVFAEWAFESIRNAKNLDDIEEYILTMIE